LIEGNLNYSPLIPYPPTDAAIEPLVNYWNTGIMAIAAAAAFIYSLVHWSRSRRPTFLLLYISGGAMMLIEPLVDTVGGCWFPEINNWIAIKLYGRSLPISLCLVYFVYFGIGVGLTWQLIRRGPSAKLLWLLFIGNLLNDTVLEEVLLHFDVYIYYGWQPLVIIKFPLWWAAVNALITMACAAIIYQFEDYLTAGWRQLLIVPTMLSVSAAVNALAGWPSWLVINSDVGYVFTQLGGITTVVLSIWVMWMICNALTADRSLLPRAQFL